MNYYERHIGDAAKHTRHFSMLEHGAMSLLLDYYYTYEQGIPEDKVYRYTSARTEEERAAVDVVLQEMFQLRNGVWIRQECEEAIARYKAGEPDRQLRRDTEQTRLEKHRRERRMIFKCLNSAGQHPKYNTPIALLRTLHETHCNGTCNALDTPETANETPATQSETFQVPSAATPATHLKSIPIHQSPDTSPQSPDAKHQTPIPNPQSINQAHEPERELSPGAAFQGAGESDPSKVTPEAVLARPLREAGVKVTSMHPVLCQWVQDGFTVKQCLQAVAIARESLGEAANISAKYLDAILRDPKNWQRTEVRPNGNGAHQDAPLTKFERIRAAQQRASSEASDE